MKFKVYKESSKQIIGDPIRFTYRNLQSGFEAVISVPRTERSEKGGVDLLDGAVVEHGIKGEINGER